MMRQDGHSFDRTARGLKAVYQGNQEIAEQEADRNIDTGVKRRSHEIEPQKVVQRHPHASRQRRRHGVDSGNKLGEQQSGLAALVERFSGSQDAGFGVDR